MTLRDLVVQVPTRWAILFAPTVVRNNPTERYPSNIFYAVLVRGDEGTRQIVESDAVGKRTREHNQEGEEWNERDSIPLPRGKQPRTLSRIPRSYG